jgi:hypothetical protein
VPASRSRRARKRVTHTSRRRAIATGAIALALTAGAIATWSAVVAHGAMPPIGAAPALSEARATTVLRTVVGGARDAYAEQHSYTYLTPAALSARAYDVPVVGSSAGATPGGVSLRVDNARRITLASPAGWHRCMFARDDAVPGRTEFVAVSTANCRASAAPATGWSAR